MIQMKIQQGMLLYSFTLDAQQSLKMFATIESSVLLPSDGQTCSLQAGAVGHSCHGVH